MTGAVKVRGEWRGYCGLIDLRKNCYYQKRERNDYLIETGKRCSGLRPMVENILDESLTEKSGKRQNGGKKRRGR